MTYTRLPLFFLFLTILLIVIACMRSSTGSNAEPAIIKGRVEVSNNNTGGIFDVADAVVTLARFTSDGSMQAFEEVQTVTDSAGAFNLSVNTSSSGIDSVNILIQVKKGDLNLKGFLPKALEADMAIEMKPITVESSGEVSVFKQVIANEDPRIISKADIEVLVGAEAAAELTENTDTAVKFARMLTSEYRVEDTFFETQSIEIVNDHKSEIRNIKTQALTDLHAKLYSRRGTQSEAYDTFIKEIGTAHVGAGIDAGTYARIRAASSHLVNKNVNAMKMSNAGWADIRGHSSSLVAVAIDNAVQARMAGAGVSDLALQSAVQAGKKLRRALKVEIPWTEKKADDFFATYNTAILGMMQEEFSTDSLALATINKTINDTTGIKAALETKLQEKISKEIIIEAYSTFYAEVKTLISETLRANSNMDKQFMTDMMILINLH